MVTAMAFSKAALVMIWRGRMPISSSRMTAWPDCRARSSRRASTAAGEADPGSAMPSASETDAMVLAVNMPAQLPIVGQAFRSMRASSSSVRAPVGPGPDRLEHAHDVEGLAVRPLAGQDAARRRGRPPAG